MFAKQVGLKPVALAKSIRDMEENAKKTECTSTPSQRSHVDRDALQQQLHAQLEMKSRKRKHITWELPDTSECTCSYIQHGILESIYLLELTSAMFGAFLVQTFLGEWNVSFPSGSLACVCRWLCRWVLLSYRAVEAKR